MQPTNTALAVVSTKKGKPTCRTRGPYPDRNRWRLTFIEEGKKPRSEIFDTRPAALAAQRAFEKRHAVKDELTVADLTHRFVEYHLRKGTLPQTQKHFRCRLGQFFRYTGVWDRPVGVVTDDVARAAYEDYTRRPKSNGSGTISVATHQEDLTIVRMLFAYAVEEKILASNPFVGVRPLGRKNRGRKQHSRDQAAAFLDAALNLAETEGDALALAAAIIVGTGARSSELMRRRVRELDEGGRVIWVREGKTQNANRQLCVPSKCISLVAALAANRPRDGLLFVPASDGQKEPTIEALKTRLLRKVKKICRLANVDVVVVHSFRGLYATLGVSSTGDPDLIARQLGHGSSEVTKQNYIDGRVAGIAQQNRVQERLGLTAPQVFEGPLTLPELTAHLDRLTEQLSVKQLQKLVEHLVGSITAKATQGAFPLRSKPAPKSLPARSKSNTEQVGGLLRKPSADPLN